MIETALLIDPWLNLKGKKRKRLLFELIKKRYHGKNSPIVKRGFSIPLATWIRQEIKEPMGDIILNSVHSTDFNFNYSRIEKMWNDHLQKKSNYHWPLFTIYSLFKWNESRKK